MDRSRGGEIRTILPFSLPLNFSMSASVRIGATTGSPETVPPVPGAQASGKPMSGEYCGSNMCASKCEYVQPRPKGTLSSLALMPYSSMRLTTHSAAAWY